jgi:hypothetical protein
VDWHKQFQRVCPKWGDYMAGNMGVDRYGVDCSCGCRFFFSIEGYPDWGICTNPRSPRAGLLTWEHQGCPKEFFKEER